LVGILQSLVPLFLPRLGSTAIGEQDMVLGVDSNSLREQVNRFIVVFSREGLVSLIFQSVGLL
jgi:hypothetical protein